MTVELREFTKAKIQDEIKMLSRKVNKLDTDIKNHNEILKENKEKKEEFEKLIDEFKRLLNQI
jgi:chromosome segregation ATPase